MRNKGNNLSSIVIIFLIIISSYTIYGNTKFSEYSGSFVLLFQSNGVNSVPPLPGIIITDHSRCGIIVSSGSFLPYQKVVVSYYYSKKTVAIVIFSDPYIDVSIIKPLPPLPAYWLKLDPSLPSNQIGRQVFAPVDISHKPVTLTKAETTNIINFGFLTPHQIQPFLKLSKILPALVHGGAIIDQSGSLIGIVTTGTYTEEKSPNFQYVVPSSTILTILKELVSKGELEEKCIKGILNVASLHIISPFEEEKEEVKKEEEPIKIEPASNVTPIVPQKKENNVSLGILARTYNKGGIRGVQILKVKEDSPAFKGGLRGKDDPSPLPQSVPWEGHIIIAVNGEAVTNLSEFKYYLSKFKGEKRLELQITTGPEMPTQKVIINLEE